MKSKILAGLFFTVMIMLIYSSIIKGTTSDMGIVINPGETFEITYTGGLSGRLDLVVDGKSKNSDFNRFDYIKYDKQGNIISSEYNCSYNPYRDDIKFNKDEKLLIAVRKEALAPLTFAVSSNFNEEYISQEVKNKKLFEVIEVAPGTSCQLTNTAGKDTFLDIIESENGKESKNNSFDYIIYDKLKEIKKGAYKQSYNQYSDKIHFGINESITITVAKEALVPIKFIMYYELYQNIVVRNLEYVKLFDVIEVTPGTSCQLINTTDKDTFLDIIGSDSGKESNNNSFDYISYDNQRNINNGAFKQDYNPYKDNLRLKVDESIMISVPNEALDSIKFIVYYEISKNFDIKFFRFIELYKELEVKPGESYELTNKSNITGILEIRNSYEELVNKDNLYSYEISDQEGKRKNSSTDNRFNSVRKIKLDMGNRIVINVSKKAYDPLKFLISSSVFGDNEEMNANELIDDREVEGIKVYIDEKLMDCDNLPVEEEGVILLPIAETFEALGAKVSWDELDRIVTVGKGGAIIRIPIDKKIAYRNNEPIELQVEAKIISEKSYAPAEFFGNALDLKYNIKGSTVNIFTGSKWDNTDLLNPIAYREVRYLPDTDQFYIRVDLNPLAGQKNEKEYPVVWLGVNDNGNWYYSSKKDESLDSMKPNPGSELTHIRYNVYEKYIPAGSLPRDKRLSFMIFVDGYNSIASAEETMTELQIIPITLNDWNVWYNLSLDKIEAVINYTSGNSNIPSFNLVMENEKGELISLQKKISEIYKGSVDKYQGKYYAAWSLSELGLERGKVYRLGIAVKGYEGHLSSELLQTIDLSMPKIEKAEATYINSKKTITINAIINNIPSSYHITMNLGGDSPSTEIPFKYISNESTSAEGTLTIAIDKLGMKVGNDYKIYIEVRNEKSKVINYTKTPISVTLKVTEKGKANTESRDKQIADSLRKLKPSENVIIYCPSINGELYWVYYLKNKSFDSNYKLVNSDSSLIFLDTKWKIVKDRKILVKLETVWKANYYFENYYAYYAKNKVGWMSDYWKQQDKAFKGYMTSKGIYDLCQELSSTLIGGGVTKGVTVGKSVSKALVSISKEYIKDSASMEKASQVVVTCLTYDRLNYVKQLDDFYVNMVNKKQSRILSYEEAYDYIALNNRAMGIMPAISARNTVFGMDDVESVPQLLIDYWVGVAEGVILIDAKTPGWLSVKLSRTFIKKCEKALKTGDVLETVKALGDNIQVFEDLYNSMQGCESAIKKDTSGNYPVTLNYSLK